MMSSDDQSAHFRPIQSQEIRDKFPAYLKQAGAKTRCELCGRNAWEVVPLPDGDYSPGILMHAQRIGDPGPRAQKMFVPTLMMSCNNCGHVRLHTLGGFLKWLQQDGGSDDK